MCVEQIASGHPQMSPMNLPRRPCKVFVQGVQKDTGCTLSAYTQASFVLYVNYMYCPRRTANGVMHMASRASFWATNFPRTCNRSLTPLSTWFGQGAKSYCPQPLQTSAFSGGI